VAPDQAGDVMPGDDPGEMHTGSVPVLYHLA
jgi:hypothetical protein